jgi:hypothetical protein
MTRCVAAGTVIVAAGTGKALAVVYCKGTVNVDQTVNVCSRNHRGSGRAGMAVSAVCTLGNVLGMIAGTRNVSVAAVAVDAANVIPGNADFIDWRCG